MLHRLPERVSLELSFMHGTGALRRALSVKLLKGHPHVARFTAAPQD